MDIVLFAITLCYVECHQIPKRNKGEFYSCLFLVLLRKMWLRSLRCHLKPVLASFVILEQLQVNSATYLSSLVLQTQTQISILLSNGFDIEPKISNQLQSPSELPVLLGNDYLMSIK